MTDTITIPLSRLSLWDGNVRRTGVHDGIDELAASIAAHGLLQSLVVRKGKRGRFEIVAGQRRFLALTALAKAGTIAKDFPVPCLIAEGDIDATEISLAENVVRAPMHPADQFEAFRGLIDNGASIADVAARFGVTETTVAKRLKLGRLSPAILEAYRNDEIGLEEAQAFAVSDDHATQERVLAGLPEWNRRASTIRHLLTEHEVDTSDRRVRFVGIDAYREAGGVIRQDLFSEDDSGFIADVALLDRLVAEKLSRIAAEVSAEGWLWVETAPDLDYQALSAFSRRFPEEVELTAHEQAELDALSDEYDRLVDSDDDHGERLDEISGRIDQLNDRTEFWSAETLAVAGAVVSIDYAGNVRTERGLVRSTDQQDAAKVSSEDRLVSAEQSAPRGDLSERLIEDLTAERSAAIGVTLSEQPEIALKAVVHALALDLLYPASTTDTCLKLRIMPPALRGSLARPDDSKSLVALAEMQERLGDRLPRNPRDLWSWCLMRTRDELLDMLAVIAGSAVDAVKRKGDRDDNRLAHADALATATGLDMSTWYTPTAQGYFARVSRAGILAAIDEAKGDHAPSLDKLKKTELATRAEQLVSGTGWLPEPLRITAVEDGQSVTTEVAE